VYFTLILIKNLLVSTVLVASDADHDHAVPVCMIEGEVFSRDGGPYAGSPGPPHV
jgi:hypothetical protein